MSWPRGRPRSAETLEKISAASKRVLADPAVRAKMSAARKHKPLDWTRRRCSICDRITVAELCEHCGAAWDRGTTPKVILSPALAGQRLDAFARALKLGATR